MSINDCIDDIVDDTYSELLYIKENLQSCITHLDNLLNNILTDSSHQFYKDLYKTRGELSQQLSALISSYLFEL
jgi:hypothetical protein